MQQVRYEFILPDIGEGMTEAEVVRWIIPVGGSVAKDQPVVELQTDKATIEIPSPVAGTLREQLGREGQVLRVGAVLFVLDVPDAAGAPAPAAAPAAGTDSPARIPQAAPAVRRLARELGVDLQRVTGTGPGGRVQVSDVQAAAAAPAAPATAPATPAMAPAAPTTPAAAAGALEERIPLRGVRRVIAEHMERAARVPAFTALDEADVTELVALRQRLQGALEQKLTFMPFVIKAAVLAMGDFPYINGHYDDQAGEFILKRCFHAGVATAAEQGLVVPVVRDAGQKSILELAAEIAGLAARARAKQLTREQLTGSTFTITNFGALGGMSGTPILNHPEVAIIGTGRVEVLPRYNQELQVVPRHIMQLALTVDHRIIDGDVAAGFLNRLKSYLQEPGLLTVGLR